MPSKRKKYISKRQKSIDAKGASRSKRQKTFTQQEHKNNRSSSAPIGHEINKIVTKVTKRVLENLRSEHATMPSSMLRTDKELTAGHINETIANLTNEITEGILTLADAQ